MCLSYTGIFIWHNQLGTPLEGKDRRRHFRRFYFFGRRKSVLLRGGPHRKVWVDSKHIHKIIIAPTLAFLPVLRRDSYFNLCRKTTKRLYRSSLERTLQCMARWLYCYLVRLYRSVGVRQSMGPAWSHCGSAAGIDKHKERFRR